MNIILKVVNVQGLINILVLFLFLLPLIFFRGFFDVYEFPKLILFYLFILVESVLLTWFLLKNLTKLEIFLEDILVVAFLLVAFISSVFSGNIILSITGLYPRANQSLIFIGFSTTFFFITKLLFTHSKKTTEIFLFLTLGIMVSDLFGLTQYLIELTNTGNLLSRVSSTESNPIFWGTLSLVGLPLSLFFWNRIFLRVVPMIIFIGLMISFSRGVWLSTFFSLVVVLLLIPRERLLKIIVQNKIYVFTLVSIGALFLPLITLRLKELGQSDINSSQKIRILELTDGLKIARDKSVLFGIGPGQLTDSYPRYRSASLNLNKEWANYPERIRNNYLDILISFGPLGLAVFLLFILSVFKTSYSQIRLEQRDQSIVFFAWLGLVILGLFYFYNTTIWVYFWLFSAYLLISTKRKTLFILSLKISYPFAFICSFALVVGIILLFRITIADFYFKQGLLVYNKISYLIEYPNEGSRNLLSVDYPFKEPDLALAKRSQVNNEKAIDLSPLENSVYGRQNAYSLALIGRLEKDSKVKDPFYTLALQRVNKLIENDEKDLLNYSIRGAIAFRMARDGFDKNRMIFQATADTMKLIELDPSNPLNFDNLGLLYWEVGDLDKAKESFERAISLKPDLLSSRLHLGETLKQEGKIEEAIQAYQEVFKYSPENTLAKQEISKIRQILEANLTN